MVSRITRRNACVKALLRWGFLLFKFIDYKKHSMYGVFILIRVHTMAKISPNSRMNAIRTLDIGEVHTITEILPDTATAKEAKENCKRMGRALGSTLNKLSKEGIELSRTYTANILPKGRIACMLFIERIK